MGLGIVEGLCDNAASELSVAARVCDGRLADVGEWAGV